jgi:hypothetical protein
LFCKYAIWVRWLLELLFRQEGCKICGGLGASAIFKYTKNNNYIVWPTWHPISSVLEIAPPIDKKS